MQPFADIFVAILAISLGALMIGSGWLRWHWYANLPKLRWLESSLGTSTAKAVNTLMGSVLIGLGIWILV